MSFARAVATVSGLTIASRLAGFVRDVLAAAVLGAGPAADAFFVALKLPNLFRRLFAEGGFSVAFVPLFAATLNTAGRVAALAFAAEALGALLVVVVPLSVLAIAGMEGVMRVMAPGFLDEPERFQRAVDFARLTFPYLTLVSVVALMGGVLNALGRFAPLAAAPVLFNLTLVAALGLAMTGVGGGEPARVAAAGVTVAGLAQLAWMLWACRLAGVRLVPAWPRASPGLAKLGRLTGPALLGAGVLQLNAALNLVLASLLPTGAVSFLYYADRLQQMPLGVIGVALGTALLPVLAAEVAAGDRQGARASLSRALEGALALGLPAAAALGVAAAPIIAALFERGAFATAQTTATAGVLQAFAIGVPATVAAKVLGAAFFARHDMSTPLKAAVATTLANLGLALALMPGLGAAGIALATGIAAWINVAWLGGVLWRRGLRPDARLVARAPRIALAAAGMAAGLALAWPALAPFGRLGGLAALVLGGAGLYAALALALGAVRAGEVAGLFARSPQPPRLERAP